MRGRRVDRIPSLATHCTLSKACDLVKPILRAEHPRTLACCFEVLIHLIQTGLSEVAFGLRDSIKDMSVEINGRDKV
jgi:hypothetical protein